MPAFSRPQVETMAWALGQIHVGSWLEWSSKLTNKPTIGNRNIKSDHKVLLLMHKMKTASLPCTPSEHQAAETEAAATMMRFRNTLVTSINSKNFGTLSIDGRWADYAIRVAEGSTLISAACWPQCCCSCFLDWRCLAALILSCWIVLLSEVSLAKFVELDSHLVEGFSVLLCWWRSSFAS